MRTAALLLCCLAAAAADWEEAHARFRAGYRDGASAEQRAGALREVAATDLPEAAELLVGVWEALERDATTQRVALHRVRARKRELREARKPDEARKKLAALEEQDVEFNARLSRIELEQAWVLTGLAAMQSPAVRDWIATEGLARAKSPALLRVLAGRGGTAGLVAALDAAKQADAIIPLLQALGDTPGDLAPAVPSVLRHLGHRDWAVRVAAAWALAATRSPEAVGPLVRRIGREAEKSRARAEVARALAKLTGKDFGPYPGSWAGWWRDNEDAVRKGLVELGRGKPEEKADHGRFYGIPQTERNIYVLDISGSMEVSMRNPRWVRSAPVPPRDGEDSRYDAARRELVAAVKRLPPSAHYAVVYYSGHAVALHEELVPRSKEALEELERKLDSMGPEGPTNIYEALDLALRLANVHPESPKGEAKADAVFLISDGSPTDPAGTAEDPERTLLAVRSWNAHQRVAIHTVGIGKEHNHAFLRRLAEENGGIYQAAK